MIIQVLLFNDVDNSSDYITSNGGRLMKWKVHEQMLWLPTLRDSGKARKPSVSLDGVSAEIRNGHL
jgi:hypothetical protein